MWKILGDLMKFTKIVATSLKLNKIQNAYNIFIVIFEMQKQSS